MKPRKESNGLTIFLVLLGFGICLISLCPLAYYCGYNQAKEDVQKHNNFYLTR